VTAWGPTDAGSLVLGARFLSVTDGAPVVVAVLDVRMIHDHARAEVLTDHGFRVLDRNATVWALLPAPRAVAL
jgi:hypothetical protein